MDYFTGKALEYEMLEDTDDEDDDEFDELDEDDEDEGEFDEVCTSFLFRCRFFACYVLGDLASRLRPLSPFWVE